MKLYQGLAVFVLLLHLGSCANMTYMCSNNYTQYERCKHIITAFEQALLEQEANIFALDNQFYPSDRYPTDSFLVGYILINGTSAPDVMIRGWCKSSTYVIASPIMLETLFTGLPYFFNVIVSRQLARSNDGFFSMMSEQITTSKNFVLNLTQYKYTKDEIEYALDYITPWVSSILFSYTRILLMITHSSRSMPKKMLRQDVELHIITKIKDIRIRSVITAGL